MGGTGSDVTRECYALGVLIFSSQSRRLRSSWKPGGEAFLCAGQVTLSFRSTHVCASEPRGEK